MDKFDLIVIGAGPGGYVAAIRAAQLGLKTAIVEREHLGGICLNWGCIPTKALLRSSEIYHIIGNCEEYGLSIKDRNFDIKEVVKRSRNVSHKLSKGIDFLLKKNKVEIIMGEGRLINKNTISIKTENNEKQITAPKIIFATGARPKELVGLEADGKLIWNYKHAMIPDKMPKSILVIGSGAIGIEFASFYNAMGTDVTIIEIADRILLSEDKEISEIAYKNFIKRGIKIKVKTSAKLIKKNKDNIELNLLGPMGEEKIIIDKVIVAAGISPNVENLGIENTKIERNDKNYIKTDEYMQTNEPGIYAIGDITPGPWLAHKSSHEAIICVEKIAGKKPKPLKIENLPGCIYSMPQIASVGLSEENAKEKGYNVKVGRFPFNANGKAIALGEAEGIIKTIYDSQTGELLGAHMIGAEVTELIQGFVIAKTLEATEEDIMHTIFPHPTLSEMMHESTLDAYGRAIHS